MEKQKEGSDVRRCKEKGEEGQEESDKKTMERNKDGERDGGCNWENQRNKEKNENEIGSRGFPRTECKFLATW